MQEYLRQLKIYIKDIAKLALPITTAFVAMGLMGIIDTMIVGNYNTDQLAYIGLANSIFVVLFTIPIGLLQGVLIKSSQKFGAHKFQSTGKFIMKDESIPLFWLSCLPCSAFREKPFCACWGRMMIWLSTAAKCCGFSFSPFHSF